MTEQARGLRKNSAPARLFVDLVDGLDLFFTFGYQPAKVITHGFEGVKWRRSVESRSDRARALKRLERQKLIEIEKNAENYEIALTKDGMFEYIRQRILSADLMEGDAVCMVIFDIPETKRALRKSLRNFLGRVGFVPLQKSVWMTHYNVGKELIWLFEVADATKWVKIFEAEPYAD